MKTMIHKGQCIYDFLYQDYGTDDDTIEAAFLQANPHVYWLIAPEDTQVRVIEATE